MSSYVDSGCDGGRAVAKRHKIGCSEFVEGCVSGCVPGGSHGQARLGGGPGASLLSKKVKGKGRILI